MSLNLSDGEVNSHDPSQRIMAVDLVRQLQPDVILTHAQNDYMPDHVEVSRLIVDASFVATLPLFATQVAHQGVTVPAMLFMDTLAGSGFIPTEYVDISDHIDIKLDALEAHQSQLRWLQEHDDIDVVEQTRVLSALRGFQSGVRYAEGFVSNLTWLRARTHRILP